MYKDIISYQLAEGIDQQHLLNVASDIIDSWMSKQAGFIRWDIHKNASDNSYTDIVYWESEKDAKNSEKEMMNIPNAGDWFACYKEGSITSQNLHQVASFN
jgi:hypothetical protein